MRASRTATRGVGAPKAAPTYYYGHISRKNAVAARSVAIPELATIASTVETWVQTLASAAPAPLQPAVQVIGGDIASVAALSPTLPGLARLSVRLRCMHATTKCSLPSRAAATSRAVQQLDALLFTDSGPVLSSGNAAQPAAGCARLLHPQSCQQGAAQPLQRARLHSA